jgi:leader peptidase (prepilin peptidase)/N-methyltransferase
VLYALFFAVLVVLSVVDIREHRLPNRIVLPAIAVGLAGIVAVSLVDGEPGDIGRAVLGGVLYGGLLVIPHLINPAGMGFGDVKLGVLLGLFLGWLADDVSSVITLVFAAAILGMVLGLVIGLVVRAGWRGAFPLGPALAAAAIVVIVARDAVLG